MPDERQGREDMGRLQRCGLKSKELLASSLKCQVFS